MLTREDRQFLWFIKGLAGIGAGIVITMGIAACAGTPTATPNDQAALCIQGVTASKKAATALLRAGEINVEQDREMQAAFNRAVPGCRLLAGAK